MIILFKSVVPVGGSVFTEMCSDVSKRRQTLIREAVLKDVQ